MKSGIIAEPVRGGLFILITMFNRAFSLKPGGKTIGDMGPEASSVVDVPAFARWFADKMAVPQQLLRQPMNLIDPTIDAVEAIASIADAGPEDLANALAPEAMEEAQ